MFDFIDEIIDLKNIVKSYRYVNVGGSNLYVQGFKEIVSFSPETIILKLNKSSLKIYGSNLTIKELNINSINVIGKIDSVIEGAVVLWNYFQ